MPTVLRRGDLTVFWQAPVPRPSSITVNGVLHKEHHGGVPAEVTATCGVIRRIRAVSQQFSFDPAVGGWTPVSGMELFSDVSRYSGNTARRTDPFLDDLGGTEPQRREVGALVDLEVHVH